MQHVRRDGVAVLSMSGAARNALSSALRRDLNTELNNAIGDPDCIAIVLRGGPAGFSAGINLVEYDKPLEHPWVDALCALIEDSPKPVVAALHGVALGAGFALALAAHARVAHSGTRFAFPDIRLGLVPYGGTTQRLPRLAGAQAALQIMATGRSFHATSDLLRLVLTRVVDSDPIDEACQVARTLARSGRWQRTCDVETGFADPETYFKSLAVMADQLKDPLSAEAGIVQCVEAALLLPMDQGIEFEKSIFQSCLTSTKFRCARHAFVAERRVANVWGIQPELGADIRDVVVTGAASALVDVSVMGLDIDWHVSLKPNNPRHAMMIRERIAKLYDSAVSRKRIAPKAREERMSRLYTDPKHLVQNSQHIVFGMDVASLDTADGGILVGTEHSEDLVHLHAEGVQIWARIYAPAHSSQLIEIAASDVADPGQLAAVVGALARSGKTIVRTSPTPGLIGRNLESALWTAALCLTKSGADPFEVDAVARRLGFTFGPFEQLDNQGLANVARQMLLVAETRETSVPRGFGLLERLSVAGESGRRKGVGFYRYDENGAIPRTDLGRVLAEWRADRSVEKMNLSKTDLQKALHAAVINEAARLLSEGAVTRASDMDVILFKGLGYDRAMGGLLIQADLQGIFPLLQIMKRLRGIAPELWTPHAMIEDMFKNGQGFYGRAT